jgi:hypothetical protein
VLQEVLQHLMAMAPPKRKKGRGDGKHA